MRISNKLLSYILKIPVLKTDTIVGYHDLTTIGSGVAFVSKLRPHSLGVSMAEGFTLALMFLVSISIIGLLPERPPRFTRGWVKWFTPHPLEMMIFSPG